MPDITMCYVAYCPSSRDCKRHEHSGTKPNATYQSYGLFSPDGDKCEFFRGVRDDRR